MNCVYWLGAAGRERVGLLKVRLPKIGLKRAGLLIAGLLSSGLVAAEPPAIDDEPSLELLEFLADYGSDSGELELPAELNAVEAIVNTAPTREQTAAPVTQLSPTGNGDPKP